MDRGGARSADRVAEAVPAERRPVPSHPAFRLPSADWVQEWGRFPAARPLGMLRKRAGVVPGQGQPAFAEAARRATPRVGSVQEWAQHRHFSATLRWDRRERCPREPLAWAPEQRRAAAPHLRPVARCRALPGHRCREGSDHFCYRARLATFRRFLLRHREQLLQPGWCCERASRGKKENSENRQDQSQSWNR